MRRALAAALLVLAACGGGGDDDDGADAASDEVTTATSDDDGTTTTAADGDGDGGDDGATTTTAAGSGGAPATTAAPSGGGDDPGVAGPKPIAAGTYRYKQSGSASGGGQTFNSPPEGTAEVGEPTAEGRQTVKRYIDPNGEPSETTFLFDGAGMFIVETVLRNGGTEIKCTFDPPLAAPPWPTTVGATYKGTGECGAFQAHVEGSITGTKSVELDGRTYEAFVLDSKISTTGQFESQGTQIDWFIPELRLSAHQETNTTGKFGEISFESKQVSDLISAIPS